MDWMTCHRESLGHGWIFIFGFELPKCVQVSELGIWKLTWHLSLHLMQLNFWSGNGQLKSSSGENLYYITQKREMIREYALFFTTTIVYPFCSRNHMEMVQKFLGPLPHLDEINFTPGNLKQKQTVIMYQKKFWLGVSSKVIIAILE